MNAIDVQIAHVWHSKALHLSNKLLNTYVQIVWLCSENSAFVDMKATTTAKKQ